MKKIQTTAPISIENLKLFFEDKETFYIIDYSSSSIKADKFLVYISNLDIPCDISVQNDDDLKEILESYLKSSFLVNLNFLEEKVIDLLLQRKGLKPLTDSALIDQLGEQLDKWTEKLESMPLFNVYTINDESMKEWVINEHETDDTTDLSGVNFLSLLKREEFYRFYEKFVFTPKYYSAYFNEYMFKGANLYSYWANENNPMFILTHAIATGNLDVDGYVRAVNKSIEEII